MFFHHVNADLHTKEAAESNSIGNDSHVRYAVCLGFSLFSLLNWGHSSVIQTVDMIGLTGIILAWNLGTGYSFTFGEKGQYWMAMIFISWRYFVYTSEFGPLNWGPHLYKQKNQRYLHIILVIGFSNFGQIPQSCTCWEVGNWIRHAVVPNL